MGNPIIVSLYDSLEKSLLEQGELSGLLGHGTLIGNAREFFVKEILGSLLSPGIEIGTGIVIDHLGNKSKQIDVVIYDPRFPRFKIGGGSIYFLEGVIAAIEVKSTLTKESLSESLKNTSSVTLLCVNGEHPEEAQRQKDWYKNVHKITDAQASAIFDYRIKPATYIFGFKSVISQSGVSEVIEKHLQESGLCPGRVLPLLPRLACCGNIISITNDGRLDIQIASHPANGPENFKIASIFESGHSLRWLAMHLSYNVNGRLGVRNFHENFDYRISEYYPIDEYMAELIAKQANWITVPAL